jgi:hypothetical protein
MPARRLLDRFGLPPGEIEQLRLKGPELVHVG